VYRRPQTPFVARFVGQMNFLSAVASNRSGWARVGNVELRHQPGFEPAAGSAMTLAIRPEEIAVGPLASGAVNSLTARIANLQFLGPFTRLSLTVEGDGQEALECDVAATAFAALGVGEGALLPIALDAEALARSSPWARRREGFRAECRRHSGSGGPAPSRSRGRHPLGAHRPLRPRALPLPALSAGAGPVAKPARQRGRFIGVGNYVHYFSTPAIAASITNSLFVSASSMVVTVTLAFGYAYAVTRTLMPARGFFRVAAYDAALRAVARPGLRPHLRLRQ
jgi:ABC-type spermidine/putrescine transport systems, ATPase components